MIFRKILLFLIDESVILLRQGWLLVLPKEGCPSFRNKKRAAPDSGEQPFFNLWRRRSESNR